MEITEKQAKWRKGKQLTPEKLALARIILDEVRNGRVVLEALRAHPMAAGGGSKRRRWSPFITS